MYIYCIVYLDYYIESAIIKKNILLSQYLHF